MAAKDLRTKKARIASLPASVAEPSLVSILVGEDLGDVDFEEAIKIAS